LRIAAFCAVVSFSRALRISTGASSTAPARSASCTARSASAIRSVGNGVDAHPVATAASASSATIRIGGLWVE
jgi:hypothetical protein